MLCVVDTTLNNVKNHFNSKDYIVPAEKNNKRTTKHCAIINGKRGALAANPDGFSYIVLIIYTVLGRKRVGCGSMDR